MSNELPERSPEPRPESVAASLLGSAPHEMQYAPATGDQQASGTCAPGAKLTGKDDALRSRPHSAAPRTESRNAEPLRWSAELPQRCGWWWRMEQYSFGVGHPYRLRIEHFNYTSGPLIVHGRTNRGFDLLSGFSFGGWWAGPLTNDEPPPPVETATATGQSSTSPVVESSPKLPSDEASRQEPRR